MLSDDDLHAIGSLVDVKFDEKLEPVLEAIREGFEQTATKAELAAMRHELMDHTDRTVSKAVGDLRVELRGDMTELRTELKGDIGGLRSELRERDLIG